MCMAVATASLRWQAFSHTLSSQTYMAQLLEDTPNDYDLQKGERLVLFSLRCIRSH